MGFITDIFCTYVIFNGRRYRVNAAYDTVLAVQDLFRDDKLYEADKINQALKMLVSNRFKVWCLSIEDKTELLKEVYRTQINLPERRHAGSRQRLIDFRLDGEYIYASFMQDYGIDLVEQQGKLHWKKFIALFQGLSGDTKIKEIMRIREMELPEPNRHNQKERQNIMELKSYYALPTVTKGNENGAELLFSTLERMAGGQII